MDIILPSKLQKGDEVRIVAPSLSYKIISEEVRSLATQRLSERGLKVSFGKNIEICNQFTSSSISERVFDLNEAFADKKVKAIFSVIGGYNSNELLPYLDYHLIRNNPKFLIGYSDTTAILNAIHAKTGLVTYYGPSFSTLGMKKGAEYILSDLDKTLFEDGAISYTPSQKWSDDSWFLDQENRTFFDNDGPIIINPGTAKGFLMGGEMTTFQLLLGTPYLPVLDDIVLMLEITDIPSENSLKIINRLIYSLTQQPFFKNVKGIIFGRFEHKLNIDLREFLDLIKGNECLKNIPIVGNVDFGHTFPMITLPIGKEISISTTEKQVKILY